MFYLEFEEFMMLLTSVTIPDSLFPLDSLLMGQLELDFSAVIQELD